MNAPNMIPNYNRYKLSYHHQKRDNFWKNIVQILFQTIIGTNFLIAIKRETIILKNIVQI